MFRRLLCLSALVALAAPALAQFEKYDPYAVQKEEPAIREDGKLNWPPFFKSAGLENRFQEYFKSGSCVGTKMSIVNRLKDNKVDVNALPETKVELRAIRAGGGMVTAVDAQGQSVMLVTHPKGVSKVSVSGQMTPEKLQMGMLVVCRGVYKNKDKGPDLLSSLLVVSGFGEDVKSSDESKLHGAILRRDKRSLTIKDDHGRHILNYDASLKIDVDGNNVDLIATGDKIEATGLVYVGEGSSAARTIFASEVVAVK